MNERETGKNKKNVSLKDGGIEIVNKIDSSIREKGYINQMKSENQDKVKKVMNGMSHLNNVCFLQVRG